MVVREAIWERVRVCFNFNGLLFSNCWVEVGVEKVEQAEEQDDGYNGNVGGVQRTRVAAARVDASGC